MRLRSFGLLSLLVLVTACGGAPPSPTYTTPQRAIEGWQTTAVHVLQEVPSGDDRLVIFQSARYPAPLIALVEYAGWDRWRPWS